GTAARRACRLWRYRLRHLRQQRPRRPQQFEGGPSALAAALTGRTPRYGYHLDEYRRATRRFEIVVSPRDLSEWGALGGIIGEGCTSYWQVPVIEGLTAVLGSDGLKHFGAALASFGSVA